MNKTNSPRNEQELFWAEHYARNYIEKNSHFDDALALKAWSQMLAATEEVSSVLECGCNIGRNIDSLSRLLPAAEKSVIEISTPAFEFVTKRHSFVQKFNGSILESNLEGPFDLVYTMGVLIHINPDELIANLGKAFSYTQKYFLIGEYFNRTPTMIQYQGEANRLFKRDFGRLVLENLPVRLLDYGFLWGYVYDNAGFDDITWWLFEKA